MATLKAQLLEKQAVQAENERLKLQLGSLQAQGQLEQKKADDDRLVQTSRTQTGRCYGRWQCHAVGMLSVQLERVDGGPEVCKTDLKCSTKSCSG